MYDVTLSESLFPAQTDGELRDITVGELLRETAARFPESTALVDERLTNSSPHGPSFKNKTEACYANR